MVDVCPYGHGGTEESDLIHLGEIVGGLTEKVTTQLSLQDKVKCTQAKSVCEECELE